MIFIFFVKTSSGKGSNELTVTAGLSKLCSCTSTVWLENCSWTDVLRAELLLIRLLIGPNMLYLSGVLVTLPNKPKLELDVLDNKPDVVWNVLLFGVVYFLRSLSSFSLADTTLYASNNSVTRLAWGFSGIFQFPGT